MSYKATGTLAYVGEPKKRTENFTTREFHIQFMDGKYEQICCFELSQDRCDIINSVKVGDVITVHFDLRGRTWKEKVYNTLNAWKVEKEEPAKPVEEEPTESGGLPF